MKRAYVYAQEIYRIRQTMSLEELNKCRFQCTEELHAGICLASVDNCPECGHAWLAHERVAKIDPFKPVKDTVDEYTQDQLHRRVLGVHPGIMAARKRETDCEERIQTKKSQVCSILSIPFLVLA